MRRFLLTVVVVGSFTFVPNTFALVLTDFALFSLNDQVDILDDVIVTNPDAALEACPPLDCETEAGTGFIGTGINGVDTAVGSNSTLTGIRTGAKIANRFSHHITINGDIVSASGPVMFGDNFTAGTITSGEDIEFGHNAYTGNLNASDEVEGLDNGTLGNITVGTGNIQLGIGTSSGTHTVTGIPLAIDIMIPSSLPVTRFTGEGNTFVNGQVFTPGQYFFDSYLPDKNQGITFDFTPDSTGIIEIFVAGITRLQQNFDITVTLGSNSCTVAEIFNGTSGGSCTDPLGLRPLAGQVVLESHGSFQIRDGADFFGTGIVPVSLNSDAIGIEVKGQGSTGFVIGALYAIDKVKLGNHSQLQYVGMGQALTDRDGDGIPDNHDDCPDSDLSLTIVIDGCDSGVDNTLFVDNDDFGNGCTISDLIMEISANADNHGQFVSGVTHLIHDLKKAGIYLWKRERRHLKLCSRAGIHLWKRKRRHAKFCRAVEAAGTTFRDFPTKRQGPRSPFPRW